MNLMTTTGTNKHIRQAQFDMASHPELVDMTSEIVSDELEALSYSISHDLRAPLRAIRNNCEWLNTQCATNIGTKESVLVQQIAQSSEQMEKLLDGLLAFSKVVKTEPNCSLIDMTTMVKKVADGLIASDRDSTSLTFKLNTLLPVSGDPLLIRQVWFNLLSNALKYTQYKETRVVEVDSYETDGEVVYRVCDNGVGFNNQYADRLFCVFQRLHEMEEFEGTGVGLAIVKRIICRHGGRVWAEGKENEGAQFYFSLPKTEKQVYF